MEQIEIDPKPSKLLHVKNVYKIAAATWVIQTVMENIANYTSGLDSEERSKVTREVDRILDKIRTKRAKDAGK